MTLRLLAATAALAFSSAVAAQPAPPAEAVTVIHAGTLMAEPGKPVRRDASIVVRGRTITQITDGVAEVPGAWVSDLRSATGMPRHVDMHFHLEALHDRMQARLQAPYRDQEGES